MYTILAIDDDKTTLGILESQLRALGYKIVAELSPVRGVELAGEFTPDVILLDLEMPVMNGFEVIQALRKSKQTKDIPVVILTINKDKGVVLNALRSGAVDYLVKPYDPNILNMKIKSAIKHGINSKLQKFDDFIEVSHRGEMCVITMRGGAGEKGFQDAMVTIFTPFFIKSTNGKICIVDIREMKDFSDDDVSVFVKMLSMFSGANIKIVTGKHYGEIVSSTDIDEKAGLFLSYGDLDHELNIG